MCVLQEDMDSGLGMCSQSLGRRAFCSSTLTAWMQRTVLLVRPELPQLAEHFCHSPTHQLTQRHTKSLWFNGPPEPQWRRQRTAKNKWVHSNGSASFRFFFPVLAVHAAICVFIVLIDLLVNSNVLFCFTRVLLGLMLPIQPHMFFFYFTTIEQRTPLQVQQKVFVHMLMWIIFTWKKRKKIKNLGNLHDLNWFDFQPVHHTSGPTYNSFTITSTRKLLC